LRKKSTAFWTFAFSTLRLHALRGLYRKLSEAAEARHVTFRTEYRCDGGRIDLVLVEGAEQYAFEFKRWQTDKESREIQVSDYKKLISFMRASGSPQGYSVIFTDNENKEMVASEKFQHDKPGFYTDAFKECLGGKYDLRDWKVIEFDTFTVCVLLATPKQDAQGA
jgi:hypothetical protein